MKISDQELESKKEVKNSVTDGVMIVDKRLETVKVGAVVSYDVETHFQTCYPPAWEALLVLHGWFEECVKGS